MGEHYFRVSDADTGNALEGARCTLYSKYGFIGDEISGYTDSNGHATVTSSFHAYSWMVRRDGYYVGIGVDPGLLLVVRLRPKGEPSPFSYEFRVTDKVTGDPLEGALCTVNGSSARTGANGGCTVHTDTEASGFSVKLAGYHGVSYGWVLPIIVISLVPITEPPPPEPPEPPGPPAPPRKWLDRVNYYIGLVPAAGLLAALFLYDIGKQVEKDAK